MSFTNLTKHNGQNSVDVAMAASGNNRLLVVVTQQIRNPVTLASVRVNGAAGGTTLVSTNTDDPNTAGTITFFIDSELPSSAGTYAVEPADSGGGATDGSMQIYYAENADQSPLIASSLGAFSNPSGFTRTAALSATAADLQVAAYSGNAPTAVVGVIDYAGGGGTHFISAQSDSDIEFTTNYIASASIAASFASISAASNSAPVVNDQTFSVADSASNGTVIGTLVATDSDGTVDNYAISGTQLSINSTTGELTLADNSGIVAGTPITATATVTDNGGGTDTATVTVNVTNSGLSFSCYDADSSNAAITSETLSHVRVLDPSDLSEVATATSIATSSTGSAEIDTDSVTIGTDYLVIARRSNGDVCEPFLVTASDLAAS